MISFIFAMSAQCSIQVSLMQLVWLKIHMQLLPQIVLMIPTHYSLTLGVTLHALCPTQGGPRSRHIDAQL